MKLSDILKLWIAHNKSFYSGMKSQRTVRYQKKVKHKEIFDHVHASAGITFVLSTGRCGTLLLTNIFERDKSFEVLHNPEVEMLYWGKYAYLSQNNQHNSYLFDGSRYEIIRNALLSGKSYIETNNRISFFAYEIARLYPNARFIHLVRHPKKFVLSGLDRGWYEDKFHYNNEGLIEPREEKQEWMDLTRAGKIAWLWNETNQFIEDFKASIPEHRHITVKSEDMFSDPAEVARMLSFVGAQKLPEDTIRRLQERPVNAGRKKTSAVFTEIESRELQEQSILESKYYGNF